MLIGGLDAGGGDPLDRGLLQVDQRDIRPVVRLVVPRLEWNPLYAESVILGDELLGDDGVVDPLADLVGDECRQLGVGLLVEEDLAVVGHPDPEAGLAVQLLPNRAALLGRDVVEAGTDRLVLEAARCASAQVEDVVVASADGGHLLGGDLAVVQRRAPVGPPLEDREVIGLLADGGDGLHAGGAGADDRHPLALDLDRFGGPVVGVERRSLEHVGAVGVDALDARIGGRGQQAQSGEQEAAAQVAAVAEVQAPLARIVVEVRRLDGAVELHVLAQVELVCDVVEVAQVLGLAREAFLPVPFLEQLVGERVAVGVALRVEAAAGVAVPEPGAAEVAAHLEHGRVDAALGQPVHLVDARDAGADDDDFVVVRAFGAAV